MDSLSVVEVYDNVDGVELFLREEPLWGSDRTVAFLGIAKCCRSVLDSLGVRGRGMLRFRTVIMVTARRQRRRCAWCRHKRRLRRRVRADRGVRLSRLRLRVGLRRRSRMGHRRAGRRLGRRPILGCLRARGRGSVHGIWRGNGDGFTRLAVDDHGVGFHVVGRSRERFAGGVYDLDELDGLDDAGFPGILRRGIMGISLAEL